MSTAESEGLTTGSMVERYAAGRMEGQEELEFERLMLEQPALAFQVNAAHRMREGLHRLQETRQLDRLAARKHSTTRFYAAAAVIVLAILGTAALYVETRPAAVTPVIATSVTDLLIRGGATTPVSSDILLAHARSANRQTTIPLPRQSSVVALRILLEVPSGSRIYKVTLERLSGNTVLPLPPEIQVPVSTDGLLHVYMNTGALRPGNYRLSIHQPAHSEQFEFRATPATE